MPDAATRISANLDQQIAMGRESISRRDPLEIAGFGMLLDSQSVEELFEEDEENIKAVLFFAAIGFRKCLLSLAETEQG